MNSTRDVAVRPVVIGASMGGVEALRALASELPLDFPAALLVILHIGRHPSIMPELLSRSGPLPATHAKDGEVIAAGRIYLGPPDHHLIVDSAGRLRLSRGPKEHHSRPAIDPLFRSAALAYGPALIGVVLTGRLDDGTAGLQAIKQCGGIAIVQDPTDAVEPSMPASALRYVEVDHCVPLNSMAQLLNSLVRTRVVSPAMPTALTPEHEHALSLAHGEPLQHLQAIATPSPFVCPDCRGGLWEISGTQPKRYRCHTGHAYTLRTLLHSQGAATDEATWGAFRALQEQEMLLRKLLEQQLADGEPGDIVQVQAKIEKAAKQKKLLRGLLEHMPEPHD